jgi:hypothetical protein
MSFMDAIWVSLAAFLGFGLALAANYFLLKVLLGAMRTAAKKP